MYDGKPILSKHAIYQDFLKVATKEEKKYKLKQQKKRNELREQNELHLLSLQESQQRKKLLKSLDFSNGLYDCRKVSPYVQQSPGYVSQNDKMKLVNLKSTTTRDKQKINRLVTEIKVRQIRQQQGLNLVSRRNSAKKIKERKPEIRKRIETMIQFRRQQD